MSTAISVQDLRKRYGNHTVVDDVSFEVREGEIFGIIGPNGAGKTTTVECLQGLRHPDGGAISVLGMDPHHEASAVRRRIGSQLQESALPDRMRVSEAIDLFATFGGRQPHTTASLERWGLADKASTPFSALSGGQQQRLFVALALVNDPDVVFLDEMTTGLDPSARRVAWDLIREVRDGGTTVVLVTHFMDEAELLCDRIAVFSQSRIVDIDTPSGLIDRHVGAIRFRFTTDLADLEWLTSVDGVHAHRREGTTVEVEGDNRSLALVCAELVGRGAPPDDIRVHQGNLEDAYLALTGG